MYTEFENLPAHTRVWIYQADRNLTVQEQEMLESRLKVFTENWAAHQQPLKASAKVFYARFVVLAVDESYNQASGCSIDSSVHFLQELEKELEVNFFERSNQAFLKEDEIHTAHIKKLKQKIAEGFIEGDTLVFNNLVTNMQELQQNWKQPAKESWLARYF